MRHYMMGFSRSLGITISVAVKLFAFQDGPSTFTVNYSSKKFILIGLLDFFSFLLDLKANKLRKNRIAS